MLEGNKRVFVKTVRRQRGEQGCSRTETACKFRACCKGIAHVGDICTSVRGGGAGVAGSLCSPAVRLSTSQLSARLSLPPPFFFCPQHPSLPATHAHSPAPASLLQGAGCVAVMGYTLQTALPESGPFHSLLWKAILSAIPRARPRVLEQCLPHGELSGLLPSRCWWFLSSWNTTLTLLVN